MSKYDLIYPTHERSIEQLKRLQNLPLVQKENISMKRIAQFLETHDSYVAFSGGKDSRVLLHLTRRVCNSISGVFADTGLEYPEIREFIKTIENIEWVKPKKTFKEVIEKYGYPVVSKKVSHQIGLCQSNPKGKAANLYLTGITSSGRISNSWKLPKKWLFLIDAPFRISDRCCDYLKKQPLKLYAKETNKSPIIGSMACESRNRQKEWLNYGCNIINQKEHKSQPLSFWTEKDIWEYISKYNLSYSKIYDMGENRTGCMFCMFGCQFKDGLGRFERMRIMHPKQYTYCMDKLGMREVLQFTFGYK